MEEIFMRWLARQTKSNGSFYAQSTMNTYRCQLRKVGQDFKQQLGSFNSIFDVRRLVDFMAIWEQIQRTQGFADYDANSGHRSFSNAMKKYQKFLEDEKRG